MYDEGRDLPREKWTEAQEAAVAAIRSVADVDGLAVRIYDDRERALDEARRELVSGAAATAQLLLKAAERLMTMAGNGTWNSPNGFDGVAFRALQDADEELLSAQRKVSDLRRRTMQYVERGGWADPVVRIQEAEAKRRG